MRSALKIGLSSALASVIAAQPACAFGPVEITLNDLNYADTGRAISTRAEPTFCAGRPLIPPGEKVAKGLLPKCVSIEAAASNPSKKKVSDAAVFGYVKTATGDSAIANNPDFKSDAGQFATIDEVPPGDSNVRFEFVAVIPDSKGDLGALTFSSVKAISYPAGLRSAAFTPCELDSLSDACDDYENGRVSKEFTSK